MEEFIKQNYSILTYTIESLAAVTGLLFYKKYKFTVAKYFICFLIYLTICDFISSYTWYVHPKKSFGFLIGTIFEKNHWWATLYWQIGAIMFFSFYYRKILKTKSFRAIIRLFGYSYFFFSIIYIILNWNTFFYKFFPILSILGAIIVFLCAVFYFIEILQSDKVLTFYKSINFYISFAIFIWWLITTPLDFYDAYLAYEVGNPNRDWNFIFLQWEIFLFANIFMYLTFTFALIWCKPENN
ncbi:hypothetical protein Q4Q34_15870 [Flavivirga abyssicola]|uniref:hypothetical protein n=1 Tax=Flavivirga abyssicola TaxID=3063533 RepID=UPI0026E1119F|nr:hypothetical protein [Flavivirga sp. MEBiC07777]WVK12694.1 hypothetical protein Q4Q34_15870 [Flavivirga sp. MEBiC07777]